MYEHPLTSCEQQAGVGWLFGQQERRFMLLTVLFVLRTLGPCSVLACAKQGSRLARGLCWQLRR